MSIISQKPVIYPATKEEQYGEMKISHFSIVETKNKKRIRIQLVNCNENGKNDPKETGFSINLHDAQKNIELYPQLKLAWEEIMKAAELLYNYHYLDKEVLKISVGGEDPELVAKRDAAYNKLLASNIEE